MQFSDQSNKCSGRKFFSSHFGHLTIKMMCIMCMDFKAFDSKEAHSSIEGHFNGMHLSENINITPSIFFID